MSSGRRVLGLVPAARPLTRQLGLLRDEGIAQYGAVPRTAGRWHQVTARRVLHAHGFVAALGLSGSATRRMSVFVSTSNSHAHHHSIHRLFENSSADRSGIRNCFLRPRSTRALRPKSPPPDWRSTRSPGEVQLSTHQESIRAGKGGDGLLATGIVCLVPTSERGPEPRDPRLHVRGGGGAAAAARGKCPFPHLVHDSEARSIRCWLYRWFHMLARSSYVVSSHVAQQRLSSGIDVAFCL
jgi:hypothetical protein